MCIKKYTSWIYGISQLVKVVELQNNCKKWDFKFYAYKKNCDAPKNKDVKLMTFKQ